MPLVVQEHLAGLAFGLVTSVQNCGLALFPVILSAIYMRGIKMLISQALNTFVIALAVVELIIGLNLNFYDSVREFKFKLNKPLF